MKKASFLTIAIIAISAATLPTMSMDNPLVATTEIPTFIISLSLTEITENQANDPNFNEMDEHACKVLGITWQKNNNIYRTDKAMYRRSGDINDLCCWTKCHPQGLPKTTVANIAYHEDFQYMLKAPTSFPAEFIKKLEEEKSITLENGQFQTPVRIIFELDSIKDLSGKTQTFKTQPTKIDETQPTRIYSPIIEKEQTDLDRQRVLAELPLGEKILMKKIYRREISGKTQPSNINKHILVALGLNIAGFIGWLIYFYQNNQLGNKLSQITDFIRNLKSNKI